MGLRVVSEDEKDVFLNELKEANKDIANREVLVD